MSVVPTLRGYEKKAGRWLGNREERVLSLVEDGLMFFLDELGETTFYILEGRVQDSVVYSTILEDSPTTRSLRDLAAWCLIGIDSSPVKHMGDDFHGLSLTYTGREYVDTYTLPYGEGLL